MSQTAITREQKAFLSHIEMKQRGGVACRFHMAARKGIDSPELLVGAIYRGYKRDAASEYFKTNCPQWVKRGEMVCAALLEYSEEARTYAAAVIEWESLTEAEKERRLLLAGKSNAHLMAAKYPGRCSFCGFRFERSEMIYYDRNTKKVTCKECALIQEA